MSVGATDKALILKHPALERLPWQQVLTEVFEFSYESVHVINARHMGREFSDIPNYWQYAATFNRKYCYQEDVLDQSGYLTDFGQVLTRDANTIIKLFIKHYQEYNTTMPDPANPELATSLDQVVVYGTLSRKALRLLNTMYQLPCPSPTQTRKYGEHGVIKAQGLRKSTDDIALDTTEHEGITYALLGKLHLNPNARKHFEQLVKYGFVRFTQLPRSGSTPGRGKIGATITPWGVRCYDLYLERFDPTVKDYHKTQRDFEEHQREMGRS